MFTRLLVGLDGSAGAEAALTAAIHLGRRFKSSILLAAVSDVRVLEAPLFGGASGLWTEGVALSPQVAELGAIMEERASKLLEAGAERVRGAGLAVDVVRTAGLVDEELIRLADRVEAVVVGRRGEMHVEPGTIGAVTAHIIKKSPKPVLVAGERATPCERPVVAYDAGTTSTTALALAARYAGAVHAPLDVVHVTEDAAEGESLLARAGAYLSGERVGYTTHRLGGEVAPAIAAHIERTGADLLVVGAHGGRRRRSWGVGSRTERLVRATQVPVIIVR